MPRRAAPSHHPVARLRAWFGLHLHELALYLNLSPALVQGLESGRFAFSVPVGTALLPLLQHLPPADAPPDASPDPLPDALPPGTPPPAAAELDFRRRQCLAQAGRLQAELTKLLARARAAHHWALALPALLAAPPPGLPGLAGLSAAEAAEREAWRRDWLRRRARPLPPAEATRAALLTARLAGLRAEAEALMATAWPPEKNQAE